MELSEIFLQKLITRLGCSAIDTAEAEIKVYGKICGLEGQLKFANLSRKETEQIENQLKQIEESIQ